MRKGTIAWLALASILSGCATAPHDENDLPVVPTMTQHATLDLRSTAMLLLLEAEPGSLVRVVQSREQLAEMYEEGCYPGPKPEDYFWVGIWNRTGLAYYDQILIDWNRTDGNDLLVALPSDPPFLVWPGATCFGKAQVEFRAAAWNLTSEKGVAHDRSLPGFVATNWVYSNVTVAPGQLTGIGTFPLRGENFFAQAGLAAGNIERVRGQIWGDLYVYEAEPRCLATDHWTKHTHYDPVDWTWVRWRGETGVPGEWRLELTLASPHPQETQWQVRASTYQFQPLLRDYGFEYPLQFNAPTICPR